MRQAPDLVRNPEAVATGLAIWRSAAPALDVLATYDWPGNVRELQHVLERAVILGRGKTLELGELLPRAKTSAKVAAAQPPDEPLLARVSLGAPNLVGARSSAPCRSPGEVARRVSPHPSLLPRPP